MSESAWGNLGANVVAALPDCRVTSGRTQMPLESLHDRTALAQILARDPGLHLYSLGDLDDDYWPRTSWFGDGAGEVVLQYAAPGLAVLLAFTERPERMRALLGELMPYLPRRFYAHLSPGLADVFEADYRADLHGEFQRMLLTDAAAPGTIDTSACEPVGSEQVDEARAFYAEAYPGNWFDPRMLSTNHYFGIRKSARLIALAGVHLFSARYGVAALGNVCVHPDYRGRNLGTVVTARTCQSLRPHARVIGLNVDRANRAAVRCYAKLGFTAATTFQEIMLTSRDPIS